MNTADEIKAAERAVDSAREILSERQGKLAALYVRRSTEKYGIEPGMKVKSRDGVFVVDEIRPDSYENSKPWLYGRKLKKDGTPGDMRRTIYGDWEILHG